MAGRSEPAWTVTVMSHSAVVGTASADDQGQWLIQPDKPLSKGEHVLELKAQNPKKTQTLYSKQRVTLSIGTPGKNRPLVALTEEGKPTRVLQAAGVVQPLASDPPNSVSFSAVDYEDSGEKSVLHITGYALPGANVMVYIENELAGTVVADKAGKWSFSVARILAEKSYAIRADMVRGANNKVVARAEVKFDRSQQKIAATKAKPTVTTPPSGNDGKTKQNAVVGTLRDNNGDVIVVRRGDTLWQIARRHYGSGMKYTQIFDSNRKQIRNPDLIYPKQRFKLPSKATP
jgi:nucleoid-associated protein YgaU